MRLKQTIFILLILSLLCGCSAPARESNPTTVPTTTQPTETTEATTQPTEATTQPTESTTQAPADTLEMLRDALTDVTHFEYKDLYMDLLSYGFEQHTVQTAAKDGSFHFINEARYWDHNSDWEHVQNVEYYYRYEDDALHYYMREDGGALQHGVLTQKNIEEMNASKELIAGSPSIFPEYLEEFTEDVDEKGQLCFRYRLPTKRVYDDQTISASFIYAAAYYAEINLSELADTYIYCTVWVNPETMQPTRLYQDYTELKPYLLSEGAQSGEYALGTDLLYVEITLGYDAPETTDIPAEFLSE